MLRLLRKGTTHSPIPAPNCQVWKVFLTSSLNLFFRPVGRIFFPTLNHFFNPLILSGGLFKPEMKRDEEKGALVKGLSGSN